jgi:PAS domain S-box-containing protein
MKEMGKYSDNDELNCGACGYATCKEKAKAVFQGRSDIENCLSYLRSKAESRHSLMIDNSPNALCTIDKQLNIKETNPTFEAIFNPEKLKLIGMPISTCLDESLFCEVLLEQQSINGRKIYLEEVDKHFIVNIIYHDKEKMALAFFTDITSSEKKKEEFEKVKNETLEKTQDVINKQMRVAQEIASLLGETTAETKMSLKSLKDLVMKE